MKISSAENLRISLKGKSRTTGLRKMTEGIADVFATLTIIYLKKSILDYLYDLINSRHCINIR